MYCTNCGKKIPDDSKFCPECGGNASETPIAQKKKKIRWPLLIPLLVVILGIWVAVFYFYVVIPKNTAVYTHPILGFTFDYPKTLSVATSTQAGAQCPNEPCFIALKNPSYNNEAVNWILVIPVALMGGDKAKLQTSLDEDVSKGLATTITVNGIKMNKYVNDPNNPSKEATAIYGSMGLDPSKEQSMYEFLTDDSAAMVGFRTPPTGAPADYDDYLNIQSWRNSSAAQ